MTLVLCPALFLAQGVLTLVLRLLALPGALRPLLGAGFPLAGEGQLRFCADRGPPQRFSDLSLLSLGIAVRPGGLAPGAGAG